ncbi:hypothetical protein DLJ53_29375 [Acuticoccus sediminis]|uniref:Methyl-accepting chemotaxis protein n=1 Tax=Acuticoccus sediminis TaxID=2184697 RepID=A0A8B2NM38_9HYPH|nr:HAMP domain-containing methyl-accepting chemotaxis protein [Acuticoccus sediminis]RAH97316.1 hypothetical protein DLJ53_29375 [Acuticoccus sediminis]
MSKILGRAPNALNNIALSLKLIASVSVVLALLLAVWGFGHRGVGEIDGMFSHYRRSAHADIFLSGLRTRVMRANLAVANFVGRNGEVSAADAAVTVNAISDDATAARAEALFEGDPAVLPAVRDILGRADTYAALFDRLAAEQRRYDDLFAELESEGQALKVALEGLIRSVFTGADGDAEREVATFEEHALLGEVEALRFLVDFKPEPAAAARREFGEATTGIERYRNTNPQRIRQTESVLSALGAYRETFDAIETVIVRRNALLRDEIIPLETRILADVQHLAEAQEAAQRTLDAEAPSAVASTQSTTFLLSIVAVLVAVAAGFAIVITVGRPIRALTGVMNRLADGDTDFAVRPDNSRDEFGQMWTALAKMRTTTEDAFSRAQMIDQVPMPVMVADPNDDFRITYMNKATRKQLGLIEHLLPIRVDEMEGASIDRFHKNPAHQRAILANPSMLPYSTTINLAGEEHLHLTCSEVRDRAGRYSGTLLSWEIVSQKVRSTRVFETTVKATMDQMAATFTGMRHQVDGIVGSVRTTQGELTAGVGAVGQAAASVQMVASAAEELSSSITEITQRISSSSERIRRASHDTQSVAAQANELLAVSGRISKVVETISDIAGKTNLLALNATIEAASAGEAGKGFAVVAHEVKDLATQTAEATQEVTQQIDAIQKQVETVVGGITEVSQTIESMRETFSGVAAAVEEQQAATHEITVNAQYAASGVSTASDTLRNVEDLSKGNLTAAQLLSTATSELSEANDNLGRESDSFLVEMKRS